jgi:hypothetical protein
MAAEEIGRTNQPVPQVTEADVARLVQRDFAPGDVAAALAMLGEYGHQSWHNEVVRVRVAVLKLAGANLKELRRHLKIADRDYRDTLAAAEYPVYMRQISPTEKNDLKQKLAVNSDWHQYREWFERK